ncbi:hypothetical protein [Paenibacillus wynnii]|uniref:SH3b domain-containing protein n=1 Tax=Paenibacillus wynnii TaxID=268407 RepID=A0A098MG03_9BACL|nr:hypothetical protein [Paenibacillus wynnii]KGE20973.1 hypothetical protein PWYN_02095 [Paenibacillus wynnii]
MKKITSFVVALGLMGSIAASASAAEVPGTATPTPTSTSTVTGSTYTDILATPIITQADIKPATPQIILTRSTPFYFSTTGFPIALLGAQVLDTTGAVMTDQFGNEWREIYTWLGKAWLKVPASAYVINP